MNVDLLWARYAEHEPGARDELILHYQPLVDRVAAGMSSGLPATVERADLAADGIFGLIEAIDSFDDTRGAAFEAFARQRIRGAILDGLRDLDWAPRSVREPARQLQRAISRLEGRLRRQPTEPEIAAEMGVREEVVTRLMNDVAVATIVRFDPDVEAFYGHNTRTPDADTLFDPERLADQLADAITALPERERVVFTLYYVEEVTFEAIGDLLGVSKVRVNQLRDDATSRVRDGLAGAA